MNKLLAFILLIQSISLYAEEELPKYLMYQYTPEVQMILFDDPCSDSDPTMGWQAKAVSGDRTASGCWTFSESGTIIMNLEDDQYPRVYYDFKFLKDKFKPVFGTY